MTDKTEQLLRDLFSHWVPTLVFALVGWAWVNTTSSLKATDRDLALQLRAVAETVSEIQVQIARLEERQSRPHESTGN